MNLGKSVPFHLPVTFFGRVLKGKLMSFEAMAWAIKQNAANSGQQLVLLLLANHTNGHTGQCNPSHQRLADECKMGLSTLKNHLKGLEEQGLIRIVHVSREGVSLPNQYVLVGVGQDLTGGGSESDWGVGQNLATKQEVKPININTQKDLKPSEVSEGVWQDFCTHRKLKKALITQRVLDNIAEQAGLAGWSMNQALTEMVSRGWMGFRAEWVQARATTAKPVSSSDREKARLFGR